MNDSPESNDSVEEPDREAREQPGGPGGPGEVVEPPVLTWDLAAGGPPVQPFSPEELRVAFLRPHRIVELILGRKERLARNLWQGRSLWVLALLLLLTSVVSTIPYGALSPTRSFWKIAILYTGSLLICFPCLHVFAQFLGFRLDLSQNFSLALVITSVAGLFTFGFCPIIWFIDYTTQYGAGKVVSPGGLSVFLLGFSLLMGIVHMGRCLLLQNGRARDVALLWVLIGLWLPLLTFITYRMARVLGLL